MFSRSRDGAGRHEKAEQPRPAPRHAARRRTYDEFGIDPDDRGQPEPTTGPYDIADAPADVERLDLGSLQIPAVQGVEVRVQASPEGQIQQVVLVHADSALQVTALAAPRSEAVWDEAREDIRAQLSRDGVSAQEVDGEYGVELRARVRAPEGPTDVRFVGIDGPRWLVRAVFQGRAATDPTAAGPLAECLHGLVVDRGAEAMPVLDPLPLRLPREIADQARLEQQPTGVDGAGAPGTPAPGAGVAGGSRGAGGSGVAGGPAPSGGGSGGGGSGSGGSGGGGSGGGGSGGGGKRRPKPRRR